MKKLTLSQVIEGFFLEKQAEHLSAHTVADYTNAFTKFQSFLGSDVVFAGITKEQVQRFLAELEAPRAPNGVARRPAKPLSKKTVLNIHTALSALWTWAVSEKIVATHLIRAIPRPDPEQRAIVPFSEADMRALLTVGERSKPYSRPGKRTSDHATPFPVRNRAILLLLLDTGVRASELCGLTICDADLKNQHIKVMGKGSKERSLPISSRTTKALWKYLQSERDEERVDAPLFAAADGSALTRDALLKLVYRLGDKAGVQECHPHRFRHTFAINFLRNGGTVFELKAALGHASLEMVERYLHIAQTDLDAAHRRASPVEKWKL